MQKTWHLNFRESAFRKCRSLVKVFWLGHELAYDFVRKDLAIMATIAPPPVIPARILPGWMSEDDAVSLLQDHCFPAWSAEEALKVWTEHSERVQKLPNSPNGCISAELDRPEQAYAESFIRYLESHSGDRHEVERIIKVNIGSLVASQYIAITERSATYAGMQVNEATWWSELLPIAPPAPQVGMRVTFGPPDNPNPLDTRIIFDLPDAEFAFLPYGNGLFGIAQLSRHVTVLQYDSDLVLKNGYHRLLARMRQGGDHSQATALVAVEKTSPQATTNAQQFLPTDGRRRARLSDFVAPGLFLDISLKRRRYQMEVQAHWRAVNDI